MYNNEKNGFNPDPPPPPYTQNNPSAPPMPPSMLDPRLLNMGGNVNGGFSGMDVVDDDDSAILFSDKTIRHAFIRKVYLILMAQLLFTTGIVCLFLFCEPVKYFVQRNQAIYWVSYGVFLVTYIVLICIPSVRRKVPGNYICLIVFTVAFSYMTGTITSFYSTPIILVALGITTGLCLALTLFAIQTKIDFTMCYGLIFAASITLLLFGLAMLITYLVTGNSFATYVMSIVYGGIAALVFSLFLVFDTQRIVGGRGNNMSPEEYIYGALTLYLDVVQLFLTILGLSGAASR